MCKIIDFYTGKEVGEPECPQPQKRGNHTRFYTLLKMMPYAEKEQIVYEASGGKTKSLSDFYATNPDAYDAMLRQMQEMIDGKTLMPTAKAVVSNATTRKLRSGVLKRMQQYGVDTTNVNTINKFILQPKIAGKLLYELDDTELQALIKKMNAILKKQPQFKRP